MKEEYGMNKSHHNTLAMLAFTAALGFSGAAGAALIDRGTGLIYDDVLDITWLADANLFKTQYGGNNNIVNQIIAAVPTITDSNITRAITAADFNTTDGRMTWWGAMAWAGGDLLRGRGRRPRASTTAGSSSGSVIGSHANSLALAPVGGGSAGPALPA